MLVPVDLLSVRCAFFLFFSFFFVSVNARCAAQTRYWNCVTDDSDETQCDEPVLFVPVEVLKYAWLFVYWVSFVTCWVVYPICQSYVVSGHFYKWARFRSAVRDNVLLYVVAGAIGGAVLVVMVVQEVFNQASFLDVLMALANAWGVLLIVAFLGHGLVEVPRSLFYRQSLKRELLSAYWKVAHLYATQEKADAKLDVVLNEIIDVRRQLHPDDPLHGYLQRIIAHCPPDLDFYSGGHREPSKKRGFWSRIGKILRGGSGDDKGTFDSDQYPTYDRLVSIHSRVMQGTHVAKSAHAAFEEAVADAVFYADVVDAVESRTARRVERSNGRQRQHRLAAAFDAVELVWYRWLRRPALIFGFVVLTLLSLLIFWCEIALTVPVETLDLSPLSRVYGMINHNGVGLQLLVIIPLTHMCVCAFVAVFQLRLWDFYALRRQKQTDAASLFFCGALFNRLTAPLAYNFLNMLNAAKAEDATFAVVVADMNAVPVLGHGFVFWVPCVVCVFGLITLTNVWNRCVSICGNCGGARLAFDEATGAVDNTTSVGREIVEHERRELRQIAGLAGGDEAAGGGGVQLESELTPHEKKLARHRRFAEVRDGVHRQRGIDIPLREFGPNTKVMRPPRSTSPPTRHTPARPASTPPVVTSAPPAPKSASRLAAPPAPKAAAPPKISATPEIVSHAKPANKQFVNDTVASLLAGGRRR